MNDKLKIKTMKSALRSIARKGSGMEKVTAKTALDYIESGQINIEIECHDDCSSFATGGIVDDPKLNAYQRGYRDGHRKGMAVGGLKCHYEGHGRSYTKGFKEGRADALDDIQTILDSEK